MTYPVRACALSFSPAVPTGAGLSPLLPAPHLPSPTAPPLILQPPTALPTPTPVTPSLPSMKVGVAAAPALASHKNTPRAPHLGPPVPLACPSSSVGRPAKRTADALVDDDGLWHCSLGCGTLYERSSGRSIRRHMTSCFRSHWPGGQELGESEVQALMSTEQESGQLVTGLRRWKKRQSCRARVDINEDETWTCPKGCSKVYRLTSSRSIQQHLLACVAHTSSSITEDRAPTSGDRAPTVSILSLGDYARAVEHPSGTITFPVLSPVSIPTTPDSIATLDRTTIAAYTPSSLGSAIPGQFDGMTDDASFMEESDYSLHAMPVCYDDHMHELVFSPTAQTAQYPLFAYNWEDTPLRMLLRRQQAEVQQISARHTTEIIALHERAPVVCTETKWSHACPPPSLQAQ
jgi:hypothetical protein